MPKAAVSMREGTLVAWLVADGATVSEGEPIYTLELEKSTMDVESPMRMPPTPTVTPRL
ncbi:MAG: hypothetical protein EBS39_00185 [Gammaproteobacteria bacterium]|nr:hypothetical protein [Gammaproteobacteria bacterium]